MELQVGEIPDLVAVGELHPGGTLDERVELGLRVMIFREERILQRQPDEAGVVPFLRRHGAFGLEDGRELLEQVEDAVGAIAGCQAGSGHAAAEASARDDDEVLQCVALLLHAEEAVVGQDHVVEKNSAGRVGQRGARRMAAGRQGERTVHLGVEEAHLLLGAAHGEMGPERVQVGRVPLLGDGPVAPVLVEERHGGAPHPFRRRAHRVECGVDGRVLQRVRARRGELRRQGRVLAGGPAAAGAVVADRDGEAEGEAAALRGIPVDAEDATGGEEAAADDGCLRGDEEIEVRVEEVVLATGADTEEWDAKDGPEAAVEVGVAEADEALGAELSEAEVGLQEVVVDPTAGADQQRGAGALEPGAGGDPHAPVPPDGLAERRDEAAVAGGNGPLSRAGLRRAEREYCGQDGGTSGGEHTHYLRHNVGEGKGGDVTSPPHSPLQQVERGNARQDQ